MPPACAGRRSLPFRPDRSRRVSQEKRSFRPLRSVLLTALSCGAFLATARGLTAILPGPPDWAVTPKLSHLAEHGDDYDVLFLGSSLSFRHVIPDVVDARLAERGVDLRSFNLGGKATTGYELDHVLREALELTGPRLRYVVVEPSVWRFKMLGPNRKTTRSRNWHTMRQTARAIDSVLESDESLSKRVELVAGHLQVAAWRVANFGEGRRLVAHLVGLPPEQSITPEHIELHRGFQALEELAPELTRERRRELLDDKQGYQKKVRAIERQNAREQAVSSVNYDGLEEQVALIRAAGAEPIYMLPPGDLATPYAFRLHREGYLPHLISFNHPEQYPQLYQLNRRFDPNHLNQRGAEEFSILLADALADLIESGELERP